MNLILAKQASTLPPFISLFIVTFLAFVCKSTAEAVSPSFILSTGSSMTNAGMQGSVCFMAAIAMRFVTGPLADAWGNRSMMLLGLAFLAVGGFACAACTEFWQIMIARCIQAVGIAAFSPSAISTVSMLAPQGKTGSYLGFYRLAVALPMAFGPAFFIEMAWSNGFGACFGMLGIVAAVSFALTLLLVPRDHPRNMHPKPRGAEPQPSETRIRLSVRQLIYALYEAFTASPRSFIAALLLSFTASIGFVLVSSFSVVYAGEVGISINFVMLFALFSVGGLVSNPLSGLMIDHIGSKPLVALGFVAVSAGLAAMGFAHEQYVLLYVTALLVGFGKSSITVGVLTIVSNDVTPTHRTLALSMQQSSGDLGSAFAASMLGFLFDATQFSNAIILVAAAAIAATSAVGIALLNEPT